MFIESALHTANARMHHAYTCPQSCDAYYMNAHKDTHVHTRSPAILMGSATGTPLRTKLTCVECLSYVMRMRSPCVMAGSLCVCVCV